MANLRLVTSLVLISLVGVKSHNISWPTSESHEESVEAAGLSVKRNLELESSSCDNLWNIINQNGIRWGLVAIPDPKFGKNTIKMQLSSSASSEEQFEFEMYKDEQSTISDIENGQPLLMRVKFPSRNSSPMATAIQFNNNLLCNEGRAIGRNFKTFHVQVQYTIQGNKRQNTARRPRSRKTTTTPRSRPRPVYSSESSEDEDCGIPEYNRGTSAAQFVIGGREPQRGQFPWLVSLMVFGQLTCGGTLINEKMVLTAAHCVKLSLKNWHVNARDASFILGGHNLNRRDGEVSRVKKFIVHPDWNPSESITSFDIAVAVLSRRVSFNKYVKPICLPTSSDSFEDVIGAKASVAGWGKTAMGVTSTNHPNFVRLRIHDMQECSRHTPIPREPTFFCAGDQNVRESTCSGDSGGGIIVKTGGKWYIRGIVSGGSTDQNGNCIPNSYGIYTDVAAFNDWIQEQIDEYL